MTWYLPYALGAGMIAISVITIVLYCIDKRRAVDNDYRRIPERVLLFCSLVGGWPGGILASRMLHHKTRKRSYRVKFALVTLTNIAVIVSAIVISQRI